MVADGFEGVGEVFEDAFAIVLDHRGFAVFEFSGVVHDAAEGFADGLVAEAYAENGDFTGEVFDGVDRDMPALRG